MKLNASSALPVYSNTASAFSFRTLLHLMFMVAMAIAGFALGTLTLNASIYGSLYFGVLVIVTMVIFITGFMSTYVHALDYRNYDGLSNKPRQYHLHRWNIWGALTLGIIIGFAPVFLSH